MLEPKYDEDTVNLGYLKKVISDTEEGIDNAYKNVSRHYASRPQPPYYKGDTWIDGDIVYTCINTRTIGLYQDSDWVTESGAKTEAETKNKIYLTQPSNYRPGDMWILQSDEDHRAGKKGEILISTAGRKEYDSDDWVNMLGYGTIKSINEVAGNLNNAINRIGNVEEAIEDGIIITFYQDTIPEGKHLGDLWYVTGEIEGYIQGKIYRYDGTNWIILNDPSIQEAFDEANEARLVADGKIQSFYSETEPTQNMGVGDLWIDLSNNNQLYRYNGTNWVAVYDTRINELVTTVETVTERVATIETDLGEIDLKVKETTTKITTIEGDIDNVETLANNAQSTADNAIEGVNNITNTQGEAEGKNIHIDDSAEEPFVDISLHGESSQKTRSGYNYAPQLEEQTINGVKLIQNSDGSITLNGTCTGSYNFFKQISLSAGDYTIQCKYIGTLPNDSNARVQIYSASASFNIAIANNSNSDVTQNRTLSADVTDALFRIRIENGFTYNNVKLYPLFIKGTYTSSTIPEFEPYGVMPSPDYPSEIENIEGKNKFNANGGYDYSTNTYKADYNIVNSNKIIITNQNGAWNRIGCTIAGLKANTKYTVSADITNNAGLSCGFYSGQGSDLKTSTKFKSKCTYITDNNGNLAFQFYTNMSGTVSNDEVVFDNIQLEEGTVATQYVPYNSLEFKVEGKNILPFPYATESKTVNGVTFTINDDGSVLANGTATADSLFNFYYNTTSKIILKSGKYVLSGIEDGSSTTYYLQLYINGINAGVNTTTPRVVSTKDGDILTRIVLFFRSGAIFNNLIIKPQFEYGSTATDYEPYKSQVATFPLGEGEKLMEGSYTGEDGIHNERKQVVFDGSDDEGWAAYPTGRADGYVYWTKAITDCVKALGTSICSHFKNLNYAWDVGSIGDYSDHPTLTYKYFVSDKATLAEWKTWLSENPITVEYELAKEEITPYTNEQRTALEDFARLTTYKNVTNITSDAYAKVVYIRDNGLDVYETKPSAQNKYTETINKFAEVKITTDKIEEAVSSTQTTLANNYDELKTKFNDYAPKSSLITIEKSVKRIQTDTYTKTEINTKLTDGSVTKVLTTAGTFDENGLTIEKTNAKTKGNFNETGIKVEDATSGSNEELLFAGYDEELGETIVRSKNMTVEKYLTIKGISRKEKYTNPVLGGKGIATYIL